MVSSSVTRVVDLNHAANVFLFLLFILTFRDPFTTLFSLPIGYALDPSVDTHQVTAISYIGAVDEAEKNKGDPSNHVSMRLSASDYMEPALFIVCLNCMK